jgi:DNA-binding CsgD family transcriptional regulator
METTVMQDKLPEKDYQAALGIINQLGECQTREELNQILKKAILPLMGCSDAFYVRLEGKCGTPQMLDSINSSTLCQCRWENFYSVATQNHMLDSLSIGEQAEVLATEAFCCIGQACSKCSTSLSNTFNHQYLRCTIVALFDSPSPAVALYFCRFTLQTQYYNERDIEFLQLLRTTLLLTIKAVMYREECHNLQQIMNYLHDHDEPLAVISDNGRLVYKNQAFDQTVGQEKCVPLLNRLSHKIATESGDTGCKAYLSLLGQSLYKVSLTVIKAVSHGNTSLNILRLSRVANKALKINRKLDKAGLSSRELEIAGLIFQGISAHDISEQLNISYHTVRNHIKHIYHKIGVSTRSEMLTWDG